MSGVESLEPCGDFDGVCWECSAARWPSTPPRRPARRFSVQRRPHHRDRDRRRQQRRSGDRPPPGGVRGLRGRPAQMITQFTNERVPIGLACCSTSATACSASASTTRARRSTISCSSCSTRRRVFRDRVQPPAADADRVDRRSRRLRRALAALRPSAGTAIYDAIVAALPLIAIRTRERAALLVISDGADTASTRPCARSARRCCAAMHSSTRSPSIRRAPADQRRASTRPRCAEITGQSGGRTRSSTAVAT